MHGIEIEEWPARIAEVAMWLIDHQMNQKVSEAFGIPVVRLPLTKSAKIRIDNALRIDWNDVLPAKECSFVLGNPPFVGAKFQTAAQREDMRLVSRGIGNAGLLDYVAGWYLVARDYVQGTKIRVAFVSTNSITQGEQVGVLWPELFRRGIKIHFAHRTFSWMSEARGKAHVHVIIIGFAAFDTANKFIYEYPDLNKEPIKDGADNISPYLVEGSDIAVTNRSTPLCDSPEIGIGNKPIDGGNYLFTEEEMKEFIQLEPTSKKLFRPWFGAREFIQGGHRWCLWLGETPPNELRSMPHAMERVRNVQNLRLASKSKPTQELARIPTRFHVENIPRKKSMVIPGVSSEKRPYIPMGFLKARQMASNLLNVIPNAKIYNFGVLSSEMHMAWVRQVCGRLESRYRYSNKLVYNNFPWPENPTEKQKQAVEEAAQAVLDAREAFPDQTLADLYDPLTMPKELRDAHRHLDRAVDLCYRKSPFESERKRVEFLFDLYQKLVAPLIDAPKRTRARKKG
jgi:hypothetical protein